MPPAAGLVGPRTADADAKLQAADAALVTGNIDRAVTLFQQVARDHVGTEAAAQALRTITTIRSVQRALRVAPAGGAGDRVVMRHNPYSLDTEERTDVSTWEKTDFVVTSFVYGASVGASYALTYKNGSEESVVGPLLLGASLYTVGGIVLLQTADLDRGDLPLALGITSYIPTTTLLVVTALDLDLSDRQAGTAIALSGLIALPVAVLATQHLALDPGDTQLVRDAGFWGGLLATTAVLGFAGNRHNGDTFQEGPTATTVSRAGLAGLGGGLALGYLAAQHTEVSLERVRVATWAGYGGGVVGALLDVVAADGQPFTGAPWRGITIGAGLGLLAGFAFSSGLDGIPPDPSRTARGPHVIPTISAGRDLSGRGLPMIGFAGAGP